VAPLRLADLLASLSLVNDLGFGLPPEEAMRTAIVATGLARRLGLAEDEVSDVYYTALLEHVGCAGFAHETAAVYGDELVLNAAASLTNGDDLGDVVNTLIRRTTRGRSLADAARIVAYTVVRGERFGRRFAAATCEVGRETARRLGLPDGVQRGVREVVETWNGKGGARGLAGDDIALVARVVGVAATVARFDDIGGTEAVTPALRARSGGELDPAVVSTLLDHCHEILGPTTAGDPRDVLLAMEPAPVRVVSDAKLVAVAAAFGDVADLKMPFTLGHANGVAELVMGAAERLRLDEPAVAQLRVAALLHDIGRVGISNAVWERRGPLTAAAWEQVRLHPYHSERILARSEALRPIAPLVGMHHERLDGSGYHRGSRARELPANARILAAADAFQAMSQDRPHRAALGPDQAATALRADADAGRLDADAVAAVLDAAGVERPRRTRRALPAGLTDREVEVLRLLARGSSNREIARRLAISPRTAEHHVQHIYTKIDGSSRAAAALFAMEHDLLDDG
jgi:HD-GYP domain-containing protein (c-di-GMP phosphodiesterase class II)